MKAEWDVVQDKLSAFQAVIRLRSADGWELHSWNIFEVTEGGGRITPYLTPYVASVWRRIQRERSESK
jgi:hypothetical protein